MTTPAPLVLSYVDRLTHELSEDYSPRAIAEMVLRDVCDFFGREHIDLVARVLSAHGYGTAGEFTALARKISAEQPAEICTRIYPQ